MRAASLIVILVSISGVTTPGPADRAPRPPTAEPTSAAPAHASAGQLPLLFIVDGVRYAGDQVPLLSADLVASVQIVKGHRALERYGPDASYGVVVITTKLASVRRS
jgi:hypothetical protein